MAGIHTAPFDIARSVKPWRTQATLVDPLYPRHRSPKGIDSVFRSETELVFPGILTQLFNPGDIDNVKKVQAGYKMQPLSKFLGQPAPAAPEIRSSSR